MKLYLVRHGQALDSIEDSARRLSAEGRAEAERLADFVRGQGLRVGEIWHSDKARARETAEILVSSGRLASGASEKRGLSPNDPVGPVVDELAALDRDVCIVGHLPYVSTLASALLTGTDAAAISFATCGMLSLVREGSGRWWVDWFVRPSLLG